MLCLESDILNICILTYNHENYIRKCLDSFIEQEVSIPFAITIFDDHSTDKTIDTIKKYYGNRINIHVQTRNVGIGKNIYDAITHFNSKYIMTFAGDDWLLEHTNVQHMYDFLEKNQNCVTVGGWLKTFNKNEKYLASSEVYHTEYTLSQYLCGKTSGFDFFMTRNIFHSAIAEWLYNGNPESNEPHHVYYILLHGNAGVLHEYIRAYRTVSDNISSNYNSTHTYIDSYLIYQSTYRRIEEKIGYDSYFKYRMLPQLFMAYKFAVAQLVKHFRIDSLKRLNAQVRLKDFVLMLLYSPFFIIGRGEYPKFLLNRIIKKHGKQYEMMRDYVKRTLAEN